MIKVRWLNTDPLIASARLRSIIPARELADKIMLGNDVVIGAKHGWNPLLVRKLAKRFIMDVCDDHFDGKHSAHYLVACSIADVVTCNSQEMQRVIKEQTDRDAIVIDDPYEDDELTPTLGEGTPFCLWFGHQSNLPDLKAVEEKIRYPLDVISSHNYGLLDARLRKCRAVVIPTGQKTAKSANRAIRAIRYGKYPVCGPLPAYAEIGLGNHDFERELEWAMTHDTRNEVLSLQRAIRERFCPTRIANEWMKVICSTTQQ